MTDLASQTCTACRADAPRVDQAEAQQLMAGIPEWHLGKDVASGADKLVRSFKCRNFMEALDLARQVGDLAEAENHHPALLVEWGKLTVSWWTHKIGGLHQNDFIMAARTDALYKP